jgi:hypothetical protein
LAIGGSGKHIGVVRKRELDRQIRKVQRATERIQRELEALTLKQERVKAQIARQRKRLEEEPARRQRKAEKARDSRRHAAEEERRRKDRERPAQERESMEKDTMDRREAAESRAERTSRLMELGGLVVIAGLLEMSEDALFGWLSGIARSEEFEPNRELWRRKGRRAAAAWKRSKGDATQLDLRDLPASESPARAIRTFRRRLATMGGVIDAAGLGHEDAMVVLGILISIAEFEAGQDWTQVPSSDVESVPQSRNSPARLERLRVTFPGPIPRSLGIALGELGLEYKPHERRWYGTADRVAVEAIAVPAGGIVETA